MADLKTTVDELVTAESDLEARVTAHEKKDADTVAALQAQIDALNNGGDTGDVLTSLTALKDRIAAFDPAPVDVPPTDTPAV